MTVSVRIRAMTVVAMANLESILDQIASKKKKKLHSHSKNTKVRTLDQMSLRQEGELSLYCGSNFSIYQ